MSWFLAHQFRIKTCRQCCGSHRLVSVWSLHHQAAPGQWMGYSVVATVIWSSGACWITPVSLSISRQMRIQAWARRKGYCRCHMHMNLLSWNFRSRKGGAVDEEMSRPVYYCRYSQDRWMKRGRTVSEAPFRWLSTRKQIRKFSAVTGDTHKHPLTQTKQGERERLCCVSSLLVPSLRLIFFLYWSVNCGLLIQIDSGRGFLSVSLGVTVKIHFENERRTFFVVQLEDVFIGCGALALRHCGGQAMKNRCLGNSHPPSSVVST